jgi:hypothetical protein
VTPLATSGRDLLLRLSLVQQLLPMVQMDVAFNTITAEGSSVEEGAFRAGTSMSSLKLVANTTSEYQDSMVPLRIYIRV